MDGVRTANGAIVVERAAPGPRPGKDPLMLGSSRVSFLLGVATLALLSLAGCKKYPNCKKDKDCQAGESCVGNICQNCKTDADCVDETPAGQAPWTCNAFRCGPPGTEGAAGGGEEGDPCTQRTDCLGGLACKQGACSLCTEDLDCTPSTCNLDSGRCSPQNSCTTDEDCAMDEICDGGMCIFSGNLGNEDGGPCGLAAVYFAFDSDDLTPKTKGELDGVAQCIIEQNTQIFLEAHADDRGTEEYNILLTERRGNMVKSYLGEKGVSAELLQVIAKGDLESMGKDESSRSKDRRVQLIWPAGTPTSTPPADAPTEAPTEEPAPETTG
jgi:peptidoglycan-associated lipoprotein